MSYFVLILGMAAVTFIPRYLPFYFASRIQLHPLVKQALAYVPIAVLTIIIVQTTLIKNGEVNATPENPYIGAALAAFLAALVQKRLLVTVTIGIVTYACLRTYFNFSL